jgi:class 3 adenylate cyclase
MARTFEFFAFRTLRAKFLALIVPLVLLSTVIVFGISELTARREANRNLHAKLDGLVEIQSAVLSESLWNVADEQVALILAAIAIDPDVLGAIVYDDSNNPVASVGAAETIEQQEFFAERDIAYGSGDDREVIGRLAIALTDARVQAESQNRLIVVTGLAVLMLLSVVAIALVTNRRIIGIPLERLLDSINRSRQKGERKPVDWASRDELGEIVSAFNEMQTRQEAYETELRRGRDDLELRVEERTKELAEKSNTLEQLSNQLAKYLSPQVYDSIFSGKQEVKVASSRKKLTVFFSDIAGFTETADRLESEELTQLLNHYLTEMSRIALDHGATIDKYVGDAILIFFGDPETKGVKEDALACVKMAIAMRKRMYDLVDIWRESGIENPLQVRMGIHTDYCTVGNFGSEDRMDYTIIGGAVNTASRLETSATPGEILISYETFAHVKEQIHCEEHGEIEVRGIAYPVATYQVVDTYENLGRERRHFSEQHPNVTLHLDLDAMTSEGREQAATILRRALDLLSHDGDPGRPEQISKKESVSEELSASKKVPGAEFRRTR